MKKHKLLLFLLLIVMIFSISLIACNDSTDGNNSHVTAGETPELNDNGDNENSDLDSIIGVFKFKSMLQSDGQFFEVGDTTNLLTEELMVIKVREDFTFELKMYGETEMVGRWGKTEENYILYPNDGRPIIIGVLDDKELKITGEGIYGEVTLKKQ